LDKKLWALQSGDLTRSSCPWGGRENLTPTKRKRKRCTTPLQSTRSFVRNT